MSSSDWLIYLVHAVFWGAFTWTRWRTRQDAVAPDAAGSEEPAREAMTAPFSRTVLAVHVLAFAVMYFGVGSAVVPDRLPRVFPGQGWVGASIIAAGCGLCCWAVASFASWRYRAKLDAGHRLATGGPFRLVRHPIYLGLDLLALGTAVWVPTTTVWVGFILMVLGSELRARSEEVVLARAFGSEYADYRARTRRFLPGIY